MELQTPTFDLHWPELTQAGIPILGLTSMATRNSLPPALAARVTQAISKPIHIHDLFDAFKPIEGKSPRPEAPATWLSTPSSFSSRSGQDGPESPTRTHRKAPQRTLRRRMASEVAHASPPPVGPAAGATRLAAASR